MYAQVECCRRCMREVGRVPLISSLTYVYHALLQRFSKSTYGSLNVFELHKIQALLQAVQPQMNRYFAIHARRGT